MTIVIVAVVIVLIYIFIGILLIALFKAFIDYTNYGKSIFSSFKKVDINTKDTNLRSIINMLKIDKKIITKNFYSDYLIICQSGIILIKLLKKEGTFIGNQVEPTIELKKGFAFSEVITNPFYKLREEKNKLQQKVNCNISEIIIKTDSTKIEVEYDSDTIVSNMSQLYYKLDGMTKKNIYTKEEVDKIYKKLVM
ncbi:MAG: hypothetical protein PHU05_06420 [Bacilli bacterium]|nr:hypothetical protein [Bacilli bacterium]